MPRKIKVGPYAAYSNAQLNTLRETFVEESMRDRHSGYMSLFRASRDEAREVVEEMEHRRKQKIRKPILQQIKDDALVFTFGWVAGLAFMGLFMGSLHLIGAMS